MVLERFEFNIHLSSLSLVHGWIYWTLRTITSPLFNEFMIWVLGEVHPWSPMNTNGWKAVDVLLNVLAGRNPDFRVVFKGDIYTFRDGHGGICSFIEGYLPLVSAKGLVRFQYAPHVENPFRKFRVV